MKYYLDTEFHEYKKKPLIGKAIDTIELISIGIVSEDIKYAEAVSGKSHYKPDSIFKSREYYAICKEFDLKAAWNANQGTKDKPDYWLRENVLKPMSMEIEEKEYLDRIGSEFKHVFAFDINLIREIINRAWELRSDNDNYRRLKKLLNKYGKTREQIAEEIKWFVFKDENCTIRTTYDKNGIGTKDYFGADNNPEFYAYYGATDWVNFYRIFDTKLLNLPKGFPWYYNELKQSLDEKALTLTDKNRFIHYNTIEDALNGLKNTAKYPIQSNEHNSLADAKWNKELHKFLTTL